MLMKAIKRRMTGILITQEATEVMEVTGVMEEMVMGIKITTKETATATEGRKSTHMETKMGSTSTEIIKKRGTLSTQSGKGQTQSWTITIITIMMKPWIKR
jgi:hypothetical protein